MKFKFIKEVAEPVMSYACEMVSTGDVIELCGWLAEKAKTNPNYELLVDTPPAGEGQFEDSPEFTLEQLRAAWQAKFGTKPHHRKSAETLREELADGD